MTLCSMSALSLEEFRVFFNRGVSPAGLCKAAGIFQESAAEGPESFLDRGPLFALLFRSPTVGHLGRQEFTGRCRG
jgi:hypothetical protein